MSIAYNPDANNTLEIKISTEAQKHKHRLQTHSVTSSLILQCHCDNRACHQRREFLGPISTAAVQTQTEHDGAKQSVCFSICQITANLRADTRLHNQKRRAAALEMTLNKNNASEDFLALNEERAPGCGPPQQTDLWM